MLIGVSFDKRTGYKTGRTGLAPHSTNVRARKIGFSNETEQMDHAAGSSRACLELACVRRKSRIRASRLRIGRRAVR